MSILNIISQQSGNVLEETPSTPSTPNAPTSGVVDDTANTFNWTNNPGFTSLLQMEQTLDGGSTVTALSAKPIVVGNVNKAAGQVGVRVKAIGINPPSAWLFNASAFNVAPIEDVPTVDGAIINDNGLYNGFPFAIDQQPGEPRIVFWKRAGSHADAGTMPMGISTDGENYTVTDVKVNGVTLNAVAALAAGRDSSGRLWIGYQDGTATYMKMAYNDSINENFTLAATITPPAGYTVNFNTDKIRENEAGDLLVGAYMWPASPSDPLKGWLYKKPSGSSTWSFFSEVFSGTNDYPTGDVNTWRAHEFCMVQTHFTGNAATGKWIAIARIAIGDEGGVYNLFRKSSDGGATWTNDAVTTDAGSFVDDNGATVGGPFGRRTLYRFLASNAAPPQMVLYNGLIYAINGERNLTNGYKLKYITATPDGAFENKFSNWSAPVTVETFNATMLGGSIDCGYGIPWIDWEGILFHSFYDVSTQPKNPSITDDRCWIKQRKIAEPS